jgi:hypothetical protein
MSMEITKSGAWIVGVSDPGHYYSKQVSDLIIDIVKKKKPSIVYDFGCGYGEYLRDISPLVHEAVGFEAYPNKTIYENIHQTDLSAPILLENPADVSISLEVGEHIPSEFEQIFIDNLCNNTKNTLILSWAVEGQIGDGHVNCRNNDYIIAEVEKRGFIFDDSILEIRKSFDMNNWFYNTLMLFNRSH